MHPIIMPHSSDSCKINLTHFSRLCNFGVLLPYDFYDKWSFCIHVLYDVLRWGSKSKLKIIEL